MAHRALRSTAVDDRHAAQCQFLSQRFSRRMIAGIALTAGGAVNADSLYAHARKPTAIQPGPKPCVAAIGLTLGRLELGPPHLVRGAIQHLQQRLLAPPGRNAGLALLGMKGNPDWRRVRGLDRNIRGLVAV